MTLRIFVSVSAHRSKRSDWVQWKCLHRKHRSLFKKIIKIRIFQSKLFAIYFRSVPPIFLLCLNAKPGWVLFHTLPTYVWKKRQTCWNRRKIRLQSSHRRLALPISIIFAIFLKSSFELHHIDIECSKTTVEIAVHDHLWFKEHCQIRNRLNTLILLMTVGNAKGFIWFSSYRKVSDHRFIMNLWSETVLQYAIQKPGAISRKHCRQS